MIAQVRTHQEFERDEREARWNDIKSDPSAMERIGYDVAATKIAMRASTADVFAAADESNDGSLQWPEFLKAASIMLQQNGMGDQIDNLRKFIEAEFTKWDVDKSLELDKEEFGAWYSRFHDWIDERKMLLDAGISTDGKEVVMPESVTGEAGTAMLKAVIRHCTCFTVLRLRGTIDSSTLSLVAQLRKQNLISVDLSGCDGLNNTAIKAFAAHCPALATLKLDGCTIGDEGLVPIAKYCPALRNVSVVGCNPGCTKKSLGLLHADCAVAGELEKEIEPPPPPAPPPAPPPEQPDEKKGRRSSVRSKRKSSNPPVAAAPAAAGTGATATVTEEPPKSGMCIIL